MAEMLLRMFWDIFILLNFLCYTIHTEWFVLHLDIQICRKRYLSMFWVCQKVATKEFC